MSAKRKSIATRVKEAVVAPLKLVPPLDKSQEAHPKAGSQVCGATANLSGDLVVCGLPLLHPGSHQGGARTWRRRSGDDD